MLDSLREKANNLPLLPGVYIMLDEQSEVIYVGKAKKLKNRRTSAHEEHHRLVDLVEAKDLPAFESLMKQHIERSKECCLAALAAREEDLFQVVYTYDSLEEKAGEFDLSFHAMRHPVPCMGVRIQNGGKTLAYTGDTNLHPGLSSFAAGADLLLIDGALPKEKWSENAPHLTVEQAASFASLAGQTVVTHHDPSFAGEEAKKAAAGCLWAAEKEEYLL